MTAASHLRAFQALELALRLGSLKAAAEALAITPAAVGQRIKALEDFLGLELMVRGRSGLAPSPSLTDAMPSLTRAFRDLELVSEILDMQRGQEIRITADPDFSELWLAPRLPGIKAALPNSVIIVSHTNEQHLALKADCTIRFGAASRGEDLLFTDYILPISSPENERRISVLSKRDRLEGFPLLHVDAYRNDPSCPGWPGWVEAHKMRRTAPDRGIRFELVGSALHAVMADAGLALCGLGLVARQLEDGKLSAPFGIGVGSWTSHGYIARFRAESLNRPQVRRFRQWLLAEGEATRSHLTALTAH